MQFGSNELKSSFCRILHISCTLKRGVVLSTTFSFFQFRQIGNFLFRSKLGIPVIRGAIRLANTLYTQLSIHIQVRPTLSLWKNTYHQFLTPRNSYLSLVLPLPVWHHVFTKILSAMAACVAVSTVENKKDFSIFLQFLGILGKCYVQAVYNC